MWSLAGRGIACWLDICQPILALLRARQRTPKAYRRCWSLGQHQSSVLWNGHVLDSGCLSERHIPASGTKARGFDITFRKLTNSVGLPVIQEFTGAGSTLEKWFKREQITPPREHYFLKGFLLQLLIWCTEIGFMKPWKRTGEKKN